MKKIAIIGGGPGGYAAAIKAAQLGAQVTLSESAALGGTCLNVGCIPTKALLHTSGFYSLARKNAVAGVKITGAALDFPAAQSHKQKVVAQLTGGVAALLRHNGVTVIGERASLLPDGNVKIAAETLEADAVILATGSQSASIEFPGSKLPGVIDSTQALSLTEVPESIAIVGGGVIGVEFAALFGQLGSKITIIEALPRILPQLDEEISQTLGAVLENDGADIFTAARLKSAAQNGNMLTVSFEKDGALRTVTAEKMLVAVGRRPNTLGLGLEEAGVKMTRGAICTDELFMTSRPGLYAVGDCNGKSMLAHAAMAQGIAAVERITGKTPRYNPKVVPACVYGAPEAASVGMTEKQAADAGLEYSVGRFNLSGNGKAIIDGGGGLVKIIADKRLGEILGVHMLGPRVTEIIGEAALCMSLEGTAEDIVNTIHAHPTVSESFCEAAMSIFGKPIHGI